jgi:hypothetical protein
VHFKEQKNIFAFLNSPSLGQLSPYTVNTIYSMANIALGKCFLKHKKKFNVKKALA